MPTTQLERLGAADLDRVLAAAELFGIIPEWAFAQGLED